MLLMQLFHKNVKLNSISAYSLKVFPITLIIIIIIIIIIIQGVSLAIGPKVFLITFKVIDVI
jgi:competence protein ComGF